MGHLSNLPPGVTDSMIPGNTAYDGWFDRECADLAVRFLDSLDKTPKYFFGELAADLDEGAFPLEDVQADFDRDRAIAEDAGFTPDDAAKAAWIKKRYNDRIAERLRDALLDGEWRYREFGDFATDQYEEHFDGN